MGKKSGLGSSVSLVLEWKCSLGERGTGSGLDSVCTGSRAGPGEQVLRVTPGPPTPAVV